MNANTYQELAQRTANKELGFDRRLAVALLGLVGEAAEASESVKKYLGHGHELDTADIEKELGDVQWYVAEVASILNLTLDGIMNKNVDKLQERYPKGFREEDSINRRDK